MQDKKRVLIVTQEMEPFLALTEISRMARELPKKLQDEGMEIRVLMPRFGVINERRHRLHEVVRLSGINIIIEEDDYPLIIKVASLPGARLQVYFLDNEDYFKRKAVFGDMDEMFFKDNAERMVFFGRGVIETVKKFGWAPDIVHCHGWMTSLVPYYMRTAFKNEPVFNSAQVIHSLYGNDFEGAISENFAQVAAMPKKGVTESDIKEVFGTASNTELNIGAMKYADGIIVSNDKVGEVEREAITTGDIPSLTVDFGTDYMEEFYNLYREVLNIEAVEEEVEA